MTRAARRLLQDVIGLPEDDRVRIAAGMLASLDGPPGADWDAAWTAELEFRQQAATEREEAAPEWSEVQSRMLVDLDPGSPRATLLDDRTGGHWQGHMPEISRFLGIVIAMYYNDHAPPHFHAKYGDFEITVRIADCAIDGQFPRRALNLVREWHGLHKRELVDVWNLARERRPLRRIDPLE